MYQFATKLNPIISGWFARIHVVGLGSIELVEIGDVILYVFLILEFLLLEKTLPFLNVYLKTLMNEIPPY